jgi:hypothetical protein
MGAHKSLSVDAFCAIIMIQTPITIMILSRIMIFLFRLLVFYIKYSVFPKEETVIHPTRILGLMFIFTCSLYHGYHQLNSYHMLSHPLFSASTCICSGVFVGCITCVACGSTVSIVLFEDGL